MKTISVSWSEHLSGILDKLKPGVSGTVLARELAAAADAAITRAVEGLVTEDNWQGVALVAVGGYGRGLLAPQSDVDLLLLHRWYCGRRARRLAKSLVPLLWDVGFKPGFAVRTPHECMRLAHTDLTCLTTLLSARPLFGDETVYHQVASSLRSLPASRSARRARNALLQECRNRLFGSPVSSTEPDLKNDPGGLRDLQRIEWIVWLTGGQRVEDLRPSAWMRKHDSKALGDANAFFWTLRWWLHVVAPQQGDRLSLACLPDLAMRMGSGDDETAAVWGAERLMQDYHRHCRAVMDVLRRLILYHGPRRPGRSARAPKGLFTVSEGMWDLVPDGQRDLTPEAAVAIVDTFASEGVEPGAFTLDAIQRVCEAPGAEWTAARRAFYRRLGVRERLGDFLRLLDRSGLLSRLVPPWERVRGLPHLTLYHAFPVDEHSLVAVEMAATGEAAKHDPLWGDLSQQLSPADWQLLHLALLVHDLGKGYREDHSRIGRTLCRSVAEALVLSPDESSILTFLVGAHLDLSRTAFHRDPTDARALRELAETVGTPRRLRFLYLLTICDILAAGPGRLTGWKLSLLQQTYRTAHSMLTGQRVDALGCEDLHTKRQQLLELGREYGSSFKSWVAMLPPYYLEAYSTDRLLLDYQRLRLLKRGQVDVAVQSSGNLRTVVVYTADRPRLMLDIVAGLYAAGTEIVQARINTLADGTVIDEFLVMDGVNDDPGVRHERIRQSIERAIRSSDPRSLASRPAVIRRRNTAAPMVIPTVAMERDSDYLLVEVFAPDYPGLLYDILSCFLEHRLDVRRACIATYGDRAVDVFYVVTQAGLPPTEQLFLRRLRHDLITRIVRFAPARHV